MMMGLQCRLVMATEMRLTIEMHKECPHCGANNNLSRGDYRSMPTLDKIPLCGSCGRPLWDCMESYVDFSRIRR